MGTNRRRQSGFTMVEQLATAAVTVAVVGAVAPGFDRLAQERRIEAIAGMLETDLQQARSAAVAMNAPVRFELRSDAGQLCYLVHTGRSGDCTCSADGAAQCASGVELLRAAPFALDTKVSLHASARSIAFDPTLGTVTPTTSIDIRNERGQSLRLVVNIMGRVRSCAAAGTLPGLRGC